MDLDKGVAIQFIPSKYKEFQGDPDYVIGLEFANPLKQYTAGFDKIFAM